MFELVVYETEQGRCPLTSFIQDLGKHDRILQARCKQMFELLGHKGKDICADKKNAVKKIKDKLYELRIDSARVFFFFWYENKIVLLHGFIKKSNKTPETEIDRAEKEYKDFIRRNGNADNRRTVERVNRRRHNR